MLSENFLYRKWETFGRNRVKRVHQKSGSFKLQRKCDSVAGQAEAEGERLTSSASGA